jgi:hypothetical protein
MSRVEENFTVEVRIPGSQKFTPEQTEAIRDLLADIDAGGYDAKFPRVITASATVGTLAIVTLTVVGNRLADKVPDKIIDKLLDIGINWAGKLFKKHPPAERRTTAQHSNSDSVWTRQKAY